VTVTTDCDTDPRAERVRLSAMREWSPARRIAAGLGYSRSLIALSRAALAQRRPGASRATLGLDWVADQYGRDLAARLASHLAQGR
jgi:hypothetical protein